MNYLKDYWTSRLSERSTEEVSSLTTRKSNTYTSYTQPKFSSDGTVITYKSGINFIPRFVQIDSLGKEKKIFVPGTLNSGKISVWNSKIIWDELTYDPRWRNRNYSIIREYDMKTGLSRKLTSRTRYSSPEFSANGDTIAVIETTPGYEFFLVLLSSSSGTILSRIPSPGNVFLQDPSWIDGRNEIAVISVNDNGEKILSYNLKTQSWREIYDAGFFNLSELNGKSNYLYFNASFDGIDNIYGINIIDSSLYKYSNSKFGAFQPDISRFNSGIVYSDYSDKGYNLKIIRNVENAWIKYIIPDKINEQPYFTIENKEVKPQNIFSLIDSVNFKVKPYSKISHLFKIHSWTPFYFDNNDPQIDDLNVSPGISIFSQNHLSTAVSTLSYEYKDKASYLHAGFTYKGLYPVFEFSLDYGGKTQMAENDTTIPPTPGTNLNYSLLSYIPLTLNTGKFYSGLRPYGKFTYNSKYYFHSLVSESKNGTVFFEPGLFIYSYLKTSQRDLQPRFGFTVHLRSINTPFENELFGYNNSCQTSIYLPGLLKNQGIKFKMDWQDQKTKKYLFNNLITFPRGIEQMPSVSLIKYTGDYAMPLFYPDINIGTIFYLKRLRADMFLDYMKGWNIYNTTISPIKVIPYKEFLSEGLELYADYHIFHIIFEFSSGIRFTYNPEDRRIKYQFLFSVNLDKF
jgi:hypothetical protein